MFGIRLARAVDALLEKVIADKSPEEFLRSGMTINLQELVGEFSIEELNRYLRFRSQALVEKAIKQPCFGVCWSSCVADGNLNKAIVWKVDVI